MFVKICGITRLEDAQAAIEYGASAIGFVFWPKSPRLVDRARARAIVEAVPSRVTTVGVFVNQSAAEINEIAEMVGLGAVQLHGDEPPQLAGQISRAVIKSVANGTVNPGDWPADVTLLVDASDPVRRGGTGERSDWDVAAQLARRRRVLLAGGLTPENVADAITAVRPFGIDVSSGVESAPGIKDRQRLKALFDAVGRS
jgi:phosphoribosylanthranilate isomerase